MESRQIHFRIHPVHLLKPRYQSISIQSIPKTNRPKPPQLFSCLRSSLSPPPPPNATAAALRLCSTPPPRLYLRLPLVRASTSKLLSHEVFSYFKTTTTCSSPTHPEFIFLQEPGLTFSNTCQKFYMEANSVGIGKAQKDTSPTTLSWFFCMLNITNAALEQMHHLHAALTETLRLYPAVPLDMLLSSKNYCG